MDINAIKKRLHDLINGGGQAVHSTFVNAAHNIGNAETNLEKNVPLYGQLQSGIRQSVAPVFRNFTTQQNVQKYQGFSQPNQSGIAGNVAKFVGQQVPYIPLMMATEGVMNPVTSKLASLVPAGKTLATAAASGAAKGAIKFAPYGWMGGLEYAKTSEERVQHIARSTLENMALGGALHATGSSAAFGYNKVKTGLTNLLMQQHGMNPQQAEEALMQFGRDELGRFSGKKVSAKQPAVDIPNMLPNRAGSPTTHSMQSPLYSPARGRLYSRSSVRFKEPDYYNTLRTAISQGIKDNMPQPGLSIKTVPHQTDRGFVKSVMEADNVTLPTKGQTTGMYTQKPNDQLMGEAKALLKDGAKINFKSVQNVDQKVAAAIQEAINQDAAGNHEAAANLFNNLAEHGTELGRGVQAFSMLDKMSPEAIAVSAARQINKYNQSALKKIPNLTGDQQKLISDQVGAIKAMTEGREKNIAIGQLQQTLNSFIPSSIADKAISVWKAGLLTSLRTHERNLFGNAIMQGSEIAKDPIASVADAAMSLRTGQRSMTTTLNGMQQFGSKETGQQMADQLRYGFDPNEANKFEIKNINWGKNPVEQALKFYTESVFRTLGVEDKPFFNSSFARSLYDQAGAAAVNAGKGGDKAFIENLVKNPTPEMSKIALKDTQYATFKDKNQLGSMAQAIKRAAQNPGETLGVTDKLTNTVASEVGKIASEMVIPFTGVPSSIAGKTVAYSPVGLIKGAIDMGRVVAGNVPELQRQAAQEIGRGVLGTGLYGLGAYLMSKGLMTGQPKDAQEAQLWQAENKQANSVLINGKWQSINSIGPQSLAILAGAKYQEEMGKPDGLLGAYATSLGKDQLNQTFLQGMSGPINALTDPNRYGASYVGNTASSVIPNGIKDIAKANDPYQRENNNVQDYMTNNIPLLRNKNIVKRDNLGNPIPQEPTGAGAFLDLFNSKTPIKNDVVNELDRLNNTDNNAVPSKLKILKQ
jgi:hypothetical protein